MPTLQDSDERESAVVSRVCAPASHDYHVMDHFPHMSVLIAERT